MMGMSCLQLILIAEIQGTHWARGNACRRTSFRQLLCAERALGHPAIGRVELKCTVRTGPTAVLATHTALMIDQDDPIFTLSDSLRRANAHAGGLSAMIAGDGKMIGDDGMLPRVSFPTPRSARDLIDPPPEQADGEIMFVFAGDLT